MTNKKPFVVAPVFWVVYDMRGNIMSITYDEPTEYGNSDDDYVIKQQVLIDLDDWNYLKQFTSNENVEKQEPF